jgi:hypothetical protein
LTSFLDCFDRDVAPRQGVRSPTFRQLFELLEARRKGFYTIVETGVSHLAAADGSPGFHAIHGQSTLLFDRFVNTWDGAVYSVDSSPLHCERARGWVSDKVHIFCHDSRAFLAGFSAPTPIDCLYLDSLEVDWSDPHSSAFHHLEELCAILPRLPEGCIVAVDDTVGGRGKGGYIVELMERIGARLLFADYQMGWQLTGPPPPLRPWGCYAPDELELVLARAAPRRYRYVRIGLDERILELLPDGRIGQGRADFEERWFAERQADGRLGLTLAGSGRITARLAPASAEDFWCGHWLIHERPAIELRPFPQDGGTLFAGRYWLSPEGEGGRPLGLLASQDVWNGRSIAETWRIEDREPDLACLVLSRPRSSCSPRRTTARPRCAPLSLLAAASVIAGKAIGNGRSSCCRAAPSGGAPRTPRLPGTSRTTARAMSFC